MINENSNKQDYEAIQKSVLDFIKRNGFVSYPEVQSIFDKNGFAYKGNLDVVSSANSNIVFWSGWNQEALDIMNSMESKGFIIKKPASQLQIFLSGGMLRLPLVTGNYLYKTPHWLPVVFTDCELTEVDDLEGKK